MDRSWTALAAALVNGALHGRWIRARHGDLLRPVRGHRFDMILTNPPYVPSPSPGPAACGKVDEHSAEVGAQYVVVDTGPWIFGKHVLLPAGTIIAVDTVQVGRTKDEIKDSPEYHQDKHTGDTDYRNEVGTYYGGMR